MISLILLIFAFALALLAAAGVAAPRVALGWLALTAYFASLLVERV